MKTVLEIFRPPKPDGMCPKSCKTPLTWEGRLIGIEVEVEDVQRADEALSSLWIMTSDGSLRNHGREFITIPMPYKAAESALTLLLQSLNETCAFSTRTSIHVHVNVQDYTLEQIRIICALYLLFEEALYQYVGGGRRNNIFCVPLRDTQQIVSPGFNTGVIQRWSKYSGLNLATVAKYGTIEFRHMAGRKNLPHLVDWINACVLLIEVGGKVSPEAFMGTILNGEAKEFYSSLPSEIKKIVPLNVLEKFWGEGVKSAGIFLSSPPKALIPMGKGVRGDTLNSIIETFISKGVK